MTLKERWAITYTWHTYDEKWHVETVGIFAENIGEALHKINASLAREMEQSNWSDYYITSINIVPELH